MKERLLRPVKDPRAAKFLSGTTLNPSISRSQYSSSRDNEGGSKQATAKRSYYASIDDAGNWPKELGEYNKRFTKALEKIKRRHDGVVTTVGMCLQQFYEEGWHLTNNPFQ